MPDLPKPDFLQREFDVFFGKHPEWIKDHEGEWVLIHGSEFAFYEAEDDALNEGYSRYWPDAFMVEQITQPHSLVISFVYTVGEQ